MTDEITENTTQPPQIAYALRVLGHGSNLMNTALQTVIGMSVVTIGFAQSDLDGTAMFFNAPEGYPPERLREVLMAAINHLDQIILQNMEKGSMQ